MADLSDKTVAVLVANYFEEPEFTEPMKALKNAGATVHVIAAEPEDNQVQAMQGDTDKSEKYPIDKTLDDADIDDYDALVIPGGTVNADKLRIQEKAQDWAKSINEQGKPLAVICHGPWLLINSGVASGRKLTSFPSLRQDLENAGADWTDEEVVIDNNLITSRNPDDLPAFNDALLEALS